MGNCTRILSLWVGFTLRGIWSALFGWAACVSSVVLACNPQMVSRLATHLPQWSPAVLHENVALQALLGGLIVASVIALLWNATVVAPRMAWSSVFPLAIKVAEKARDPVVVRDGLARHTVSVIVKNRSPARSIQCNAVITAIVGPNNARVPWSISRSTIAANDEQRFDIANWFFGEDRQDDPIRIGHDGGGYWNAESSFLMFPQPSAEFRLTVRAPECREVSIWCRLLIDNRQLLIEKIFPPADTHA